uniref:Uncharacterized protein n=1 Tax=Rhizophora mucronata TaxID=61149 RepID=A0A2P2PGD5_RHIMU
MGFWGRCSDQLHLFHFIVTQSFALVL